MKKNPLKQESVHRSGKKYGHRISSERMFFVAFLFSAIFSHAQMGITASVYMMPVSVPCNSCFTFSADVSGGNPPYNYQWTFAGPPSVTYSTQTFTHCLSQPLDSAHYLWFHVSDVGGMNTFDWPLFDAPIKFTSHPVCMVSVDSASGKNLIVWEQTTDPSVVSYNVYKESTTSGVYTLIGNAHRNSFSTYTDSTSNPAQVAARYKISMIDYCGNESYPSNAAKTIHLAVSAGMQNSWNLNWDNAEGFPVVKFRIWRQHASQSTVLIDSVQSSLNSYTDMNAPGGLLHYTLEAISTNVCNPSLKTIYSPVNSYSSSFSNFVDNSAFLGVDELNSNATVSVYPNPFTGKTALCIRNSQINCFEFILYDVYGNELRSEKINSRSFTIDRKDLPAGIYFYKMAGAGSFFETGKLIAR